MSSSSSAPLHLPFSEFALSPKGACQFGADALASGRVDLAESLVQALGPVLLPKEDSNPWEGPAGAFWRAAFTLDRLDWLTQTIGALPKDQAQLCARDLLMQSAKAKAFESFDYLLSLGAARRSKKVMEAAYLNGGCGAAIKVKKPTANEAEELLKPHSRPQSAGAATYEDMLWCASFLAPDHRFELSWIKSVALIQGDALAARCVADFKLFKLALTPATAPSFCAHLAAAGASQAALGVFELFNLRHDTPIAPQISLSPPARRGDRYCQSECVFKDPSLIECALLGRASDFCDRLIAQGAQPPSLVRLSAICAPPTERSWLKEKNKTIFEQANALRETLELRGAMGPSALGAKPAARSI